MVSDKKIAIPIFRGRVSPVFDWAERLLVIETDGPRREVSLAGMTPVGRAELLGVSGVEVLLCCGISQALLALIESKRIDVLPHVAGDVEEVVAAYSAGRLADGRFAMPGCMRKARGRRCRRGRL